MTHVAVREAMHELADDEFRKRLRSFLEREVPRVKEAHANRLDRARAWARLLADDGCAAPSWPIEFGGMDLPTRLQIIYHEEMTRARAPGRPDTALGMVGPSIIRFGTPQQQRRFLPRILRADDIWCQGFSEPGAGSDLPSLTTRAVLDGGEYVVNGQKVWTTNGQFANWCFALVRTGTAASRQKGLTYLLIDMDTPGVLVRPLRDMTGGIHFTETFFDDVRVPVSNRLGDENDGWRVARNTLGHERSTSAVAGNRRYRRITRELYELARELGRGDDPTVRQALARIETEYQLLSWADERILQRVLEVGEPGPISSLSRIQHTLFEQHLHETATSLLGADALLFGDALEYSRSRWLRGFLHTRASTIGGGTTEVQRNAIGEQVLGLPHDPGMPGR
jgi:alkylation response protein AidB-like acyl-CoA dehydrogenase